MSTKGSKDHKSSEQQIACPVCNKKIQFSQINTHLDICTQGGGDVQGQPSIASMMYSRNRLKRGNIDESTVVDLEQDSSTESVDSPPLKITKTLKLSNTPHPHDNYEIRWLEKMSHLPLSEKLRPKDLKDYVGQQHILSHESGTLWKYISEGVIPSMILWGPPGVGKTTLARLMTKTAATSAAENKYTMIETSATKANTQELRSIFEKSKKEYVLTKRRIVLFIDEIHRFNKTQQDLLLPHVENGDVILIGATTENPSFQLNNALISRCLIFTLCKLSISEICIVLSRAVALLNKLRKMVWKVDCPLKLGRKVLEYIADMSAGDTRRALNILEMIEISTRVTNAPDMTVEQIREIILSNSSIGLSTYYDTKGDNHYDTISAFHKAIRGSDDNAALYYLGRMLQGGEDPLYIARRMIRIASEDIGIRDNSLLPLAVAAHDAVMKVGLPEADMALVQCCVALARSPKSIEIYSAWNRLKSMLAENKYGMASSEIPMHIRNAPTKLMQELGYHKGYKYNPDYLNGQCCQEYMPQEVLDKCEDPDDLRFLKGKHLGSKVDPDLLKGVGTLAMKSEQTHIKQEM